MSGEDEYLNEELSKYVIKKRLAPYWITSKDIIRYRFDEILFAVLEGSSEDCLEELLP